MQFEAPENRIVSGAVIGLINVVYKPGSFALLEN
jgi:hypothetical protein